MAGIQNVININVGGRTYTVLLSTLTKYPDSLLGLMFNGNREATARDQKGRFFIDANGDMFEYILDFLRRGQLFLPEKFDVRDLQKLHAEAEFYQIRPLIHAVNALKFGAGVSLDDKSIKYKTVLLLIGDVFKPVHVGSYVFKAHFKSNDSYSDGGPSTYVAYSALLRQLGYTLLHRRSVIKDEKIWKIFMYVEGFLSIKDYPLPHFLSGYTYSERHGHVMDGKLVDGFHSYEVWNKEDP